MTRPLPLHKQADVSDSDERSPWARKTILALDGGGIKGYSQLLIEKRLMYKAEQIERGFVPGHDRTFSGDYEATDFKPHHYFDYCVGTSTGGLGAIMLGRMEMDVETALKQYDVVGNQVFGHPRLAPKIVSASSLVQPKYASWRMEKALQDVTKAALHDEMQQWGTSEKTIPFQSDAERSRTMVVARGKNLARKTGVTWRPYLFRTFDHLPPAPFASPARNNQHLNPGHAHRMPIWQVARATSAAPTYFEPLKAEGFMFKDGGLGTNNPASVALQEVTQLHEQKPLLLLSIGTGRATVNDDEDSTSDTAAVPGGPKIPSFLEPLFENLAVIKYMQNLVTETEQVHEHMQNRFEDEAAAFPHAIPTVYHRLNVSSGIGRVIPLDSWRPASSGAQTKAAMLAATMAYLSRPGPDAALRDTAQLLVRLRRRRAATE
ncbi:acyl transferase/acyl hydrolase/lysophospholipase, partial [Phyllosticta citriasiana]